MSLARAALALAALVGCQFDERGPSPPSVGADSGQSVDTPSPADAAGPPDLRLPDSASPCVDADGDSYLAAAIPGASCDEPRDCDDSDARAHPGQQDFFDVPRLSGGFDYDCDGEETPLDASLGHECMWDWFWCAGTGWLDSVPACGQEGSYHWCEPDWEECRENSRQVGRMPCR